jgi:hypothetical protein
MNTRKGANTIQAHAQVTLERILTGMERELLEATDAEIAAAAAELGMEPGMKGSAAFAGVKYGFGLLYGGDPYGVKRRAQLLASARPRAVTFRRLRARSR